MDKVSGYLVNNNLKNIIMNPKTLCKDIAFCCNMQIKETKTRFLHNQVLYKSLKFTRRKKFLYGIVPPI